MTPFLCSCTSNSIPEEGRVRTKLQGGKGEVERVEAKATCAQLNIV